MTVKSETTYVWRSNVLHHIFTNHNPSNSKENYQFFVISVACFEETLLMENKFLSHNT